MSTAVEHSAAGPDTPVRERSERLALRGVVKTFGQTVAVRDASLTVGYGEIHALIGENGAGKSTLMRVLAGHMGADAGSLVFEGVQCSIQNRVLGHRPGIGFVEQEGGLIGELTGAENLLLAQRGGLVIDRNKAGERIRDLARRFGGDVDTSVPVHRLPMGQRQRLEILIVLALGANVLILDEPTASLAADDAKILGQIVRTFASDGGTVLYISHKLHEVKAIAEWIWVMRRGEIVACHGAEEVTVNTLAAEMLGEMNRPDRRVGERVSAAASEDLIDVALGAQTSRHHVGNRRQICALQGVSASSPYKSEADLKHLDLTVHSGEIVGVAGVVGSGQTVLAEILSGLIRPETGVFQWPGGKIAYIPENRHRDAVALGLSIRDNLVIHVHSQPEYAQALFPRREAVDAKAVEMLQTSRVLGATLEAPVSSLSGGNQQKLVLGRELEQAPLLVVAHNPFRGLDVRAISDVKDALIGACEAGAGVVMISSDLDEIIQLADRIVVLFDGRTMGEVTMESGDLESVGKMMGGVSC
jgi:ABC-type uncharacterized transport system ATPase subunit